MRRYMNLLILTLLGSMLVAACSSELNDPDDLPSAPILVGAHGKGYAVENSENFHGTIIRTQLGWNITSCTTCHGADYSGAGTGQSCSGSGCHVAADGGPEACYLCHGDAETKKIYPQWYPSHATHLEGGMDSDVTVACSDCHQLPENYADPIHIDTDTPGKAEVQLNNALASLQTSGTVGIPGYDAATGSCANVYCHGNFTNGNNKTVAWKGDDQAVCGSCHGDEATGNPMPGGTHPQLSNCAGCHTGIVDENQKIIDRQRHINGVLNVFGQERTNW